MSRKGEEKEGDGKEQHGGRKGKEKKILTNLNQSELQGMLLLLSSPSFNEVLFQT
jgi:hypothetical protein